MHLGATMVQRIIRGPGFSDAEVRVRTWQNAKYPIKPRYQTRHQTPMTGLWTRTTWCRSSDQTRLTRFWTKPAWHRSLDQPLTPVFDIHLNWSLTNHMTQSPDQPWKIYVNPHCKCTQGPHAAGLWHNNRLPYTGAFDTCDPQARRAS